VKLNCSLQECSEQIVEGQLVVALENGVCVGGSLAKRRVHQDYRERLFRETTKPKAMSCVLNKEASARALLARFLANEAIQCSADTLLRWAKQLAL
jgi:hypothetical protein